MVLRKLHLPQNNELLKKKMSLLPPSVLSSIQNTDPQSHLHHIPQELIHDASQPKLPHKSQWLRPSVPMDWFAPTQIHPFHIEYDEIEGAKIAVALPQSWNGGLLIHCHGHRAVGIGLRADLSSDQMPESYRELLSEGWIVSMTSYRREGIVLKDAIQDVNNLRKYVEDRFGKISCCILEGRSMGGAIATYLSELHGEWYDGAVCIGAALRVDQKNEPLPHLNLKFTPKFPILYLTNMSELGEPSQYIEKSKEKVLEEDDIVVPALWTGKFVNSHDD